MTSHRRQPPGPAPAPAPEQMADTEEDEQVAEEGQQFGLDPDLAVFVARDELPPEAGTPP